MRAVLPAVAVLALSSPLAASADPLLQRLLAESAKAPVVAFERTTKAEIRADPGKEPALVVDRFTPKSADSGSWTVVSIDGRKPAPQELEAHAKGNGTPPGFHNLHRLLSQTPTSRREAGGKTIYFWKSLPKGAVVTPGGDISGHLSAEATLDGTALDEVRIFAGEPFRVKIVASINRFNITSHYKTGANALPFLTAQVVDTDVTAPMGMGGKRRSVASFKPL
ncbi:hypothetical protein [Sandaracinobacter sp.]|jgi:hypothetical protein|uniref:hypothetical protein n=1 Tax=Sandaracinobacter sp. TaxID=2487581 RepID=UPI0035B389B9